MLVALRKEGVRSLMVEGGASVIQSFLENATPSHAIGAGDRVIDTVIVTVAPLFVGAIGTGYGANLAEAKVCTFLKLWSRLRL